MNPENNKDIFMASLYDDTNIIFMIPADSYHNDMKYIRTGVAETDCLIFDDINGEFNTNAIYIYDKKNKTKYIRIANGDNLDMTIRIKEIKKYNKI